MGAALAAGGHFNPQKTGHGTPNDGHMGDLPVLNVDSNGNAKTTLIAPRLKLADIQGLAIMIHAGGDNYSDHPKPLGGGGDRIACDAKAHNDGNVPNNLPHVHSSIQQYYAIAKMAHQ
ncbi:unnamed protein product [Oppiella nova]|uniref:Superoxide dismutase copper/zinc binding domain-containing protein n=1 Tax=Oppiella nova TaxID=334625 RepID=A0A7R9L6T8_9ACAR|nr:unnamed protein product [Oppiella nova]CAG2155623.1 unnamed protein product [Oppiella nova]